jgi:DNA-binding CsgD family transcriptional regulator
MAQLQACPDSDLNCADMTDAVTSALQASGRSNDKLDEFVALAASLGFDGFSYLVLTHGATAPQLLQHWTTAGQRWASQYATRGYHVIDPRVTRTRGRSVPIVWDDAPEGVDLRARAFLADARRHSIRGGVAMSLYDVQGRRSVVAWDSRCSIGRAFGEEAIRGRLGTLALLAGFVHEAMVLTSREPASDRRVNDLTLRERECLALGAHGMTSADIGLKLGISERTANFHFGNVVAKFGALNRAEAIARAVAMNLVSLGR